MSRLVLMLVFSLCSQIAFANDISTFFDRLQGKWILESGEITNLDGRGNVQRLKITELTSTVEKISETEWKFVEHYCVETDCADTTYSYNLVNGTELFLVNEQGRSEVVTINSSSSQIKFLLQSEESYSVTDCHLTAGNVMTQEGFTINSDFTQSDVKLSLKKSEL